jgi:hypothetical protein
MKSVVVRASDGFTQARAATELGVPISRVRALLRSGRLRGIESPAGLAVDPITLYDWEIAESLWDSGDARGTGGVIAERITLAK